MNRSKKILAAVLLGLAVCGGLIALLRTVRPLEQTATPQRSALEFYQQREEAIDAFAVVLDAFALEHPEGSIVQNRTANSLEYLSARIQRGDMPDLFTHWPTQISFDSAVSAGKVLALQDEAVLSRVEEDALALCREENGAVYALPINRNCMEVYYNADLFASMGLSEPETVDELLALCEAIQDGGWMPLTFYIRDSRTAHMAQAMMAALNDDYLTLLGELAEGAISDEDRDSLLGTLRLMREMFVLYSDQDAGRTYYDACENFARGGSAMIITGSYGLSLLRGMEPEFEMDVFAFPGWERDSHTILTSIDTAVCVSSDCADPDLALDFLETLTRKEIIAQYAARDSAPSCIKGVYQKDPITQKMQKQISEYENEEWIKSRYALESCIAFENAICSYMISGDEEALIQEMVGAFG